VLQMWQTNTAGRLHRGRVGHAAADSVVLCRSLGFTYTPCCIHIHLTIFIPVPSCPVFSGRCCVRGGPWAGVSVYETRSFVGYEMES
jgi:hypothetical protein